MLTAEILTIGAELLRGSALNTNARFLGRQLTDLGFWIRAQIVCGDLQDAIVEKLRESLGRSDLVILTGGLGPTPDDVTRDAIAKFFQVPLILSRSQLAEIRRHYRKLGRRMPMLVRREALFPQNAKPLINRYGIALGFYLVHGSTLVVALPGVPVELEKLFRELVRPLIRRHFKRLRPRPSLVIKTVGLPEPRVMEKLGRHFFDAPFDFGIYPEVGEVSLRIQADKKEIVKRCQRRIRSRLGPWVYADCEQTLAESVGKILARRARTLATAESCTGGLLASEITKVGGASRYFKGGITLYSNAAKKRWFLQGGLERSVEHLAKRGAVSSEIALALAAGIRREMGTTYGIGITGIAGPSGATRMKPLGIVFIALSTSRRDRVWKNHFWGDRNQVQAKAVMKALEYLWREIR